MADFLKALLMQKKVAVICGTAIEAMGLFDFMGVGHSNPDPDFCGIGPDHAVTFGKNGGWGFCSRNYYEISGFLVLDADFVIGLANPKAIETSSGTQIIVSDYDFEAIKIILAELNRARTEHPIFPSSVVRQAAILCEEAGECIQEANRIEDDGCGDINRYRSEAAQTGAMAIRILCSTTNDQ